MIIILPKTIYIFNPINGVKSETTYEKLSQITGIGKSTLASIKCRRIKLSRINSYIIDESFTKKDLYSLMDKEIIKDERWKPVSQAPTSYSISNYGRVRNGKKKLLHPYIKKGEWLTIKICGKEKYIHLLVAQHFLKVPKGKCVYHKNGNIQDNFVGNIGFCTRKELGKMFGGSAHATPVLKIDIKTGDVLDSYENMRVAGDENYVTRESIREVIIGKRKTAAGFYWRVDEEFLNN